MSLTEYEKLEIVQKALKKNVAELLAIEDAQQNLLALLLGILGAGASFLSAMTVSPSLGTKIGLTLLDLAVVCSGVILTSNRDAARRSTRALLVRCEDALGFYTEGALTPSPTSTLYPSTAKERYVTAGNWLGRAIFLVVLAGVAFAVVVWSR